MIQKYEFIFSSIIFMTYFQPAFGVNKNNSEFHETFLVCKDIYQNTIESSTAIVPTSLGNDFLVFWHSKETVGYVTQQLRSVDGGLFRGMYLTAEEAVPALKNIVVNGLETKWGQDRKIYFSKDPQVAMKYMWAGHNDFQKWDKISGVRILLKVIPMRNQSFDSVLGVGSIWTSAQDIPSTNIDAIYVFDKTASLEFPFRKFSIDELKLLLGQ
jgi:hypothetical protein